MKYSKTIHNVLKTEEKHNKSDNWSSKSQLMENANKYKKEWNIALNIGGIFKQLTYWS